MTQGPATAVQVLGTFVASLDDMPATVRERAVTCLVYNIGLARATRDGRGTRPAHDLALAAYGMVERQGATLFLSGTKSSPAGAAFGNAVLFGAGGRGDTLGTIHVGQVVTSALLALTEAYGLPPERLVPALVAGYEVGGRLDRAYGEAAAGWGFRSTPLHGAPAAAAAAARLLGLDAARTASAIGVACCMTGGLLQPIDDGSDEPRLQAGAAAQLGLTAALAAQRGTVGAAHALEGPFGLVRAAARREVDLGELTDELGSEWLIQKVTYKPFPVCAFAQTPVYAGLSLREKLAGALVKRLSIRLHPREAAYPGLDFTGPFATAGETTMSAPFAVVHGLVHGRPVDISALMGLGDPAMGEILAKTELHGDANVPALSTVIEAELGDGRTILHAQIMTAADYALPFDQVRRMVRGALAELPDAASATAAFDTFVAAAQRGLTPHDVAQYFGFGAGREQTRGASPAGLAVC